MCGPERMIFNVFRLKTGVKKCVRSGPVFLFANYARLSVDPTQVVILQVYTLLRTHDRLVKPLSLSFAKTWAEHLQRYV